tara:strand:- start:143 stop:502 length:360 start_codon:yes stop_codon:yes gene_type:complete
VISDCNAALTALVEALVRVTNSAREIRRVVTTAHLQELSFTQTPQIAASAKHKCTSLAVFFVSLCHETNAVTRILIYRHNQTISRTANRCRYEGSKDGRRTQKSLAGNPGKQPVSHLAE